MYICKEVLKTLRHITTIILSVVVLISTSGFTVFHHTCNSSQTSELSLIIPDFSCEHFQDKADEELPPCCTPVEEEHDKDKCGDDKCCNTKSFSVKLDITLKVVDFSNKIVLSIISPDLRSPNDLLTGIPGELSNIIISNDLPPPLGGKDLHIFLHQLNIPSYSV